MSSVTLSALESTHLTTKGHLRPAVWCGRKWQKISDLDGSYAITRVFQAIVRIIPAFFLAFATIPAVMLAISFSASYQNSSRTCSVNATDDIKSKLKPEGLWSRKTSEEKRAAIEQKLSNPIFSLCSVAPETLMQFPIDAERRDATFAGMISDVFDSFTLSSQYKAVLRVNRSSGNIGRMYDAFRGPVSTDVQSNDVLNFLLGIEMDAKKKQATEKAILSLESISLHISANFERIEMVVGDPGTFYPANSVTVPQHSDTVIV